MAPSDHVGIIVWCQNTLRGMHLIERKTEYGGLLQILSEMTGFSLSQYSFSVSAKLWDGDRSQVLSVTCTRDLSFFFNRFDQVELYVDIQALPQPPSSHVPLEEMYTHVDTYTAGGESEQPHFDLNYPACDAEDETRHHDTIAQNELLDDLLVDGPDPGASGPESDSSDDNGGVPLQTPVFHPNQRIPSHPTLSRASFFESSFEEVYVDSVDMPRRVFTYDPDVGMLAEGMIFPSKLQVQTAVKNYSIKHAMREYYVMESKPTKWNVGCKQNAEGTSHGSSAQQCNWFVKAKCEKKSQLWKIKQLGPPHSCLINSTNQRHYNLDRNLIAEIVAPYVRKEPSYTANCAQVLVKQQLNYDVSYNMAWKGIKRAIQNVYGTWESSCAYLPRFMTALKQYNPGSVVEWHHLENFPMEGGYTLGYVFWAFKPVIDAWQHCRRVITVDGTHLYTNYKHKLLIAIGVDANQRILPLAYAIVDEESKRSWRWFLNCLSVHVIRGANGVCLISDRHKGILKAVEQMAEFREPKGVHRYCLRHVGSNLNSHFKSVQLKDLCYAAGKAPTVTKFERHMEEIKELCIGAWEYLSKLDKEKWTYSHDGGYRFGVMTTNMSECFNGVLVGARRLPITAIVKATFTRSVKSFVEREKDARRVQQTNQKWPDSIRKSYDDAQRLGLSAQYGVEPYNIATLSASVHSMLSGSRRGITYRVTLSRRECSCGEWSSGGVPCSHAMAVCRSFGYDPETFVHWCFSSQAYIATYTSGCFFALGDEEEWDEPNFKLRHNPELRVSRRGRAVSTRIPNEMDWAQTHERQQYQARNRAGGSNLGSTSRRR